VNVQHSSKSSSNAVIDMLVPFSSVAQPSVIARRAYMTPGDLRTKQRFRRSADIGRMNALGRFGDGATSEYVSRTSSHAARQTAAATHQTLGIES
jgi:hypothetical protein